MLPAKIDHVIFCLVLNQNQTYNQGGQVGYSPDFPFHPGGPGSTPSRGN